MTQVQMTYAGTGVDYGAMDPFKLAAQRLAVLTAANADRLGITALEETRGESVYLFKDNGRIYGHVEEGLGTKNLVADAMYKLTEVAQYYSDISQDAVAMIVNDMVTLGIQPLACAMHLAVGDSGWFKDERRSECLLYGWKNACDMAGCLWSVGETPTLKGVVVPGTFVLSGSAIGRRKFLQRLAIGPSAVRKGDSIVFLGSSGIHANGLTLAREIAEKLPNGYLTQVEGASNYGDELLKPTHIYAKFVEMCIDQGINIHYAVNITGHGWRKLMRAPHPFAYVIEAVPEVQPIFKFIQNHGPVSDEEAYGNLNMGAGFALYVQGKDVQEIIKLGKLFDFKVMYAGHIDESPEKKVIIKPKGIEYLGSTLSVR